MKAKTQMVLSLCGAVFLIGYAIFIIDYCWPLSLPNLWIFCIFGVPLIFLTMYILSVIRKDLKTIKIIFGIWQIFAVVTLFFIVIFLILLGMSAEEMNYSIYKTLLIMFICCAIPYGFTALVLWMGIRGLKRMIGTENEHIDQEHFV